MEDKSIKFRPSVKNRDGYMARRNAIDPRTGEKTYASKVHKGMNYAHPVSKDGKPTRYFQFMMEIVANPGITRKEIIAKVYDENYKLHRGSVHYDGINHTYEWGDDHKLIHVSDGEGYMNSYFSAFSGDGFIKTTTKGGLYPTKKLIDYVNDFIEDVDSHNNETAKYLHNKFQSEEASYDSIETSALFEKILGKKSLKESYLRIAECPICGAAIEETEYDDYTCPECEAFFDHEDLDFRDIDDEFQDGAPDTHFDDVLDHTMESVNLKDHELPKDEN